MPSSIRHEIGQLLFGSLPAITVTPEIRSLIREFQLGGLVLFNRNIEDPMQVGELSSEIQALAPQLPRWISIDQEGGRVARLGKPFTEWPPMNVLGRSGDIQLASKFAVALAAELRAVGVTLNFAPVLDIHTNPKNSVIGDRALGTDASTVAKLGAAIIHGFQNGGIAACGKHFPGHGDTVDDSHIKLPVIEHDLERLRRVEMLPFRAAVEAGVAFIMTAHLLIPSIDKKNVTTFSKRILEGMLRKELGFQGVILGDDLEMKSVSATQTVPDAAVQAVIAGCDGILICSGEIETQVAALEALLYAIEDGRISRSRIEDVLKRQRNAKGKFLAATPARNSLDWSRIVGCDQHKRIADKMAGYL